MIKAHQSKSYKNLTLNFAKDNSFCEPSSTPKESSTTRIKTSRNIKNVSNFFPINKLKMVSPKFNTPNKVLTPYNRIDKNQAKVQTNVSISEQPKRPKILNRVRNAALGTSFNQQFKIGKVLGKGRFGNVCLARHRTTNSIFAVKKIGLEKMSDKLLERIIAEIKIQLFLNHESCLQLYKFYKESNAIILILEVGDQSLFDLLRQRKFFTEKETANYIKQTISAIQHLHFHGVIHRDLKPENIVLVNNVVKLADFGWSIYTGKTEKRKTFCGTLDYVSPEIVLGSQYDEMVDVWSVGVLCYQLCTGHAPFQSSRSRKQTYRKILSVDLKFPRHLSELAKDFIRKLLVRDPSKRMTLEEALEHSWMRQFKKKEEVRAS